MKELHYDVVVCGAGVAGVAAAVAAARYGAKTAIIEKQCLLGGLATSGLIYIYLPLCDGNGKQLAFGLAEEMLKRCVEYGPFDVPEQWGGPKDGNPGCREAEMNRYSCCFSPAGFTLTLDKMLEEAGVDLWLDTLITDAEKDGNRITAVEVVNLSGKIRISGKCFVDATGCALAAKLAGVKVISEVNHITPWILEMASDPSFFHFTESLHVQDFGEHTDKYAMDPPFDGRKVTDFVRRGWQMIREHYDRFSRAERTKNYPVHLPAMPQIRKIAHIDAFYNLTEADVGKHFDHPVGMAGNWYHPDPGWEAPYESLVPKDLDGLLAAGRCIGARGYAWEIFRVIPAAALTGEAAGTAAALCAGQDLQPRELPYSLLEKHLHSFRTGE
ncbi:MAG: FAD-dependent oxidoreductase [Lentisphaeria bacterium]|nr:FAD-dependent oxidoreductase [Lentisphaeria bacterium]